VLFRSTTTVDSGATLLLNKPGVSWYTIPGSLVINGTVRLLSHYQFFYLSPVTINDGGLLDMNGYSAYVGALTGSGGSMIGLNGGYLFADYGFGGTSTFGGLITGTGTLNKQGSATLILTNNNAYTGLTDISYGTLLINGSQPQCPVSVETSGVLGGSGTVGPITANGIVAPGSSPGILTCSNVALASSANLKVELTGPTPGVSGYDQLNVRGAASLASATLTVNPAFTTPVSIGQQFTILNNDLSEAITGTFSGLAEGATINAGGYTFTISYVSGTGNDVVLTLTSIPCAVAGSAVLSGNGDGLISPNECLGLKLILTNKTATPMTGISASLSSADPNVMVTQPLSVYPDAPSSGRSTNATAFQVSILPSFACGNDFTLNLTVATSSHGSFVVPILLQSGGPSVLPVRYDNNIVTNVPDIGTIESTNTVASWSSGSIAKVAVSLWLVAPFSSDMTLTLIAPDGTSVLLSSGNGSGANFGSGSADAQRSTFDDAAATSILAGASPFVGSYRPQTSLTNLNGTGPVGNWRLRIQDSYGSGSPDTLRCWSLFLYGTTCGSGGGACALCPDGTIYTNTLDTSGAVMANRLFRNGVVSACGSSKPYPGTVAGSFHYHAYPFYNASSDACITVTLTSFGGDVMSSAYLGTFNPADLSINYLADSGSSTGGASALTNSFNVPGNSIFVVVVNNVGATGTYSLSVSGGDCTPVLNIAPVSTNKVDLNWLTIGGGYKLEATPSLTATSWLGVTNEPIATGNRFDVTNSTIYPSNRYYRLHKP
jgi:autotransporter-associated beta strand protein